jgi:hypothetical protein
MEYRSLSTGGMLCCNSSLAAIEANVLPCFDANHVSHGAIGAYALDIEEDGEQNQKSDNKAPQIDAA